MRLSGHHLLRKAAVLGVGIALVSSVAGVTATSASAEAVKGTMTITLKDDVAYLVTDDVWSGIGSARVGMEPAGSPYPGATLAFPLSFEDGWFKVYAKGGLALGPGGIPAMKPTVVQTPEEAKKKFARVYFTVGQASRLESPFYVKRFKEIGTDTEGFVLWKGQLYVSKDASVVKAWNELSGLKGGDRLKAGQHLGILRLEVKAR